MGDDVVAAGNAIGDALQLLLHAQTLVLQLAFEKEGRGPHGAQRVPDLMGHGRREVAQLSHPAAPRDLVLRVLQLLHMVRQFTVEPRDLVIDALQLGHL